MELDDLSCSVVNGSSLHEAELCPLFCPRYKINVYSELPLGDPLLLVLSWGAAKKAKLKVRGGLPWTQAGGKEQEGQPGVR